MIPCPRDNATARIASTPVLSYGLRRAYTILTQALDDGWRPRTPKAVLSSLSLSLLLSVSRSLSQPPSSPAGRRFSGGGINEWYPEETSTAVK